MAWRDVLNRNFNTNFRRVYCRGSPTTRTFHKIWWGWLLVRVGRTENNWIKAPSCNNGRYYSEERMFHRLLSSLLLLLIFSHRSISHPQGDSIKWFPWIYPIVWASARLNVTGEASTSESFVFRLYFILSQHVMGSSSLAALSLTTPTRPDLGFAPEWRQQQQRQPQKWNEMVKE